MLVLITGPFDDRLAGIVSHILATRIKQLEQTNQVADFKILKELFESSNLDEFEKDVVGPLPVVSSDQFNSPSPLHPIQAVLWFITFGGRFDSKWENRITRVVPKTPIPLSPQITAPFIKVPTLMLVEKNDEMVHCNPEVQLAVFNSIKSKKEFYAINGGHFGCLHPDTALFQEALQREVSFIKSIDEELT